MRVPPLPAGFVVRGRLGQKERCAACPRVERPVGIGRVGQATASGRVENCFVAG